MKLLLNASLFLLLALPQAAHLQERNVAQEERDLEGHHQLWKSQNIRRYEFLLELQCFMCAWYSPARVVVENGSIVAVLNPETGEPMRRRATGGAAEVPALFEWYRTIDQLFAEMESALANRYGTTHPGPKSASFSVEYDPKYGYPVTFSTDYSRFRDEAGNEGTVTDSGMGYRISEFKAEPFPTRGTWIRTAEAPLDPRNRASIAWAGGEIFVFGGTHFYCAPNASCILPRDHEPPLADGAAYDPATDSWRAIADAPAGIAWSATATVGDDIFVLAVTSLEERTMKLWRYRPAEDDWSDYALPEDMREPGIVAFGARLLLVSRNDDYGPASDWLLDIATGEWSRLPDDPLGPGFGRQYIPVDDDLYLFAHVLVAGPDGRNAPANPSYLHSARLRGGQWELLPEPSIIAYGPYLRAGNLIVAPKLGCGNQPCIPFGAVFDMTTDTWRELPNAPGREARAIESSGALSGDALVLDTLARPGNLALDADTDEWFTVPALDADRNTERSLAAAGPYGFAFGGARPGGLLLNEAWIWKP